MNYHNITTEDMNNGDGLRTVLWTAGCDHHCKGCQNPQTWNPDGGIPFDEDAVNEIMADLNHDYISGITFSGGDPLYCGNRETVYSIIKAVKEKFGDAKTVWCYTGFLWEDVINFVPNDVLKNIDVIVDGEFILEQRNISLKWKGSANQRVIDVKATLASDTPTIPILHCSDEVTEDDKVEDQYFNANDASCCKE